MHIEGSGMYTTNAIDPEDLDEPSFNAFDIKIVNGGNRSPAPSMSRSPLNQTPEMLNKTPSKKLKERKGTAFIKREKPASESSESPHQEGVKNKPMTPESQS